MRPKTRLRHHAEMRIERPEAPLSLDPEDILRILDDPTLHLPIGMDERKGTIHLLFWSAPNRYWFVAVVDNENGDVVTILPVDYHSRWKVSPDALLEARRMITKEPTPEEIARKHQADRTRTVVPAGKLRVDAAAYDYFKGVSRKFSLIRCDAEQYGGSAAAALYDPEFREVVSQKLRKIDRDHFGPFEVIVCRRRNSATVEQLFISGALFASAGEETPGAEKITALSST